MTWSSKRRAWLLGLLGTTLWLAGCEDTGKKSAEAARAHVGHLVLATASDVEEIRQGLPQGASAMASLFEQAAPETPDPQSAKDALTRARAKVQDLRVAKSTFFAVTTKEGTILRSDGDTDEMAEKNVFSAYPELKDALSRGYVETQGTLPEASGVRGRPDAQWVAAAAIKRGDTPAGLYVTGWSWSAYAYRLETAIRSKVLGETEEGAKVPLLYVYVLAGGSIFGAPVSPMINAEAIQKLRPLEHAKGEEIFSQSLEIDRRSFGVAVQRAPALGDDVAIAVLRSET